MHRKLHSSTVTFSFQHTFRPHALQFFDVLAFATESSERKPVSSSLFFSALVFLSTPRFFSVCTDLRCRFRCSFFSVSSIFRRLTLSLLPLSDFSYENRNGFDFSSSNSSSKRDVSSPLRLCMHELCANTFVHF